MNFYDLHSDPKSLDHHEIAHESVPKLAWKKYEHNFVELKKREHLWAKDAELAYKYASKFLDGPFKIGEPAMAKVAYYAYSYARDVLDGPFKLGEPIIAKTKNFAWSYGVIILNMTNAQTKEWIAKFE